MVSLAKNRESIRKKDEVELELHRLQEVAKLAAMYHNGEKKFQKRTDLSYIVHISLHFVQFEEENWRLPAVFDYSRSISTDGFVTIGGNLLTRGTIHMQMITTAIEIFHHVHHYINDRAREKDDTVPALPEERNPIFFLYPICMLMNLVLMSLWLVKKIIPENPLMPLTMCATGAILMLVTGIMEMKHADMYIDITEFTDEEILEHPIFIHNFVMCILSIFVMTLYLIQAWVLFDQWQWIRKEQDSSVSCGSKSSTDTDESGHSVIEEKISERDSDQEIEELAPIPTLKELIARTEIIDSAEEDDEPILYCCFVDWYNYMKMKMESKPKHEFRIIHVM